MKRQTDKLSRAAHLFLIHITISFIGWCWETVYVSYLHNHFEVRGFLFGPLCPIYGVTILIAYAALGSIMEPRGLLAFSRGKKYRFVLYPVVAALLPTLFELLVGPSFEWIFGVRFWDYSYHSITLNGTTIPLHLFGYISLPVTLIWCVLITAVLGVLLPLSLKLLEKLPRRLTLITALIFAILLAVDTLVSGALYIFA